MFIDYDGENSLKDTNGLFGSVRLYNSPTIPLI